MAVPADKPELTITPEGARVLLPYLRCARRALAGIAAMHRAAGISAEAEQVTLTMQRLDALCLDLETLLSPELARQLAARPLNVFPAFGSPVTPPHA